MTKKSITALFILIGLLFILAACRQYSTIDQTASTPTDAQQDVQTTPTQPVPDATETAAPTATPKPIAATTPKHEPTKQPQQTPKHEPTPGPTVNQEPEYIIENGTVYLQTAQEKRLVYIAAAYYEADAVCGINDLLVEEDTLYFREFARDPNDDYVENTIHSIIRIDQDGRQVLDTFSSPWGYMKLIPYQDRLIFVTESGDSCSIGDVAKDGSDSGKLMEGFAPEHGYPYFGSVDFIEDGDRLVLEGNLYLMRETEWLEGTARLVIYPDFHMELVWLSEPDTYSKE